MVDYFGNVDQEIGCFETTIGVELDIRRTWNHCCNYWQRHVRVVQVVLAVQTILLERVGGTSDLLAESPLGASLPGPCPFLPHSHRIPEPDAISEQVISVLVISVQKISVLVISVLQVSVRQISEQQISKRVTSARMIVEQVSKQTILETQRVLEQLGQKAMVSERQMRLFQSLQILEPVKCCPRTNLHRNLHCRAENWGRSGTSIY